MADCYLAFEQAILAMAPEPMPFNWQVKADQVWFIQGAQYDGKTTLLKSALGLISLIDGDVALYGQLLHQLGPTELQRARQHCSLIMSRSGLIEPWTVFDNLALPLHYLNLCKSNQLSQRIVELMQQYQIPLSLLDQTVNELSHEWRQQISFLRALATKPLLLLVDAAKPLRADDSCVSQFILPYLQQPEVSLVMVADPAMHQQLPLQKHYQTLSLQRGHVIIEESAHDTDAA